MLEAARAAGAVAVSSIVDRRNVPMMRLNETLGGVVEDMPDDPNHCRCVIPLGS